MLFYTRQNFPNLLRLRQHQTRACTDSLAAAQTCGTGSPGPAPGALVGQSVPRRSWCTQIWGTLMQKISYASSNILFFLATGVVSSYFSEQLSTH